MTTCLTGDNADTDGEGQLNGVDTADDHDGLLDVWETGGGSYVGDNRNFVLGPNAITQTVPNPAVYFSNDFDLPVCYTD